MPSQPGPRLWPRFAFLLLLCALVLGTAVIYRSWWATLALFALTLVAAGLTSVSYFKSSQRLSLIKGLAEFSSPDDNYVAYKMLAELTASGSEKRPVAQSAQEIIRQNLRLDNFVIFFREDDRYIPKIISGINKSNLASPPVHRLSKVLKSSLQDGVLSSADNDLRLAYKDDSASRMEAPVAFTYSWGRNRSVLAVVDDTGGYFAQLAANPRFNRAFWPGLDYSLRTNQKLTEYNSELKNASVQLSQAKSELADVNRELKNKLVDIQSFVRVSNELYSLFNEEQLFRTLRETVTRQVGAGSVDIMVPDGEGKFVVRGDSVPDRGGLTLDRASELCELIMKSARPVPLPLAGSGIGRGEPFLDAAIAAGIVVASAIRAGGETACILLIGEKGDNPQYSNQDMDFIYVVSNIASLALDNIYQYSTIEKLSYTDSMTGVFNYRYFYKRLNEEILRAKRYERELSLVILDIDNFKSFNDNFGHQAGDLILRQLSDLITRTIRSIDVVSRYGGEEFCIIMPDTGIGNCAVFIERLRSHIAEFKFESELFVKGSNITVSVGGAVYPHQALTPDRLIYCADMALLKAKSIGRNKAIMYEPEFSLDVNSAEGGINESHQESIF